MALSSTSNRNDYTGNGAVSSYSYTFPIVSNSDLVLTVVDTSTPPNLFNLVLGTDYTVSGAGVPAGGSISLVNSGQSWLTSGSLTTGYKLIIRRVRPLTQTTDIRNQGVYFPEIIEDTFDGIVMMIQQLQEEISRCVTLPVNYPPAAFSPTLPENITTPQVVPTTSGSGNGFVAVIPASGGGGGGGFTPNTKSITGNYSGSATDNFVSADCTLGAIVVAMPTPKNGQIFSVVKKDNTVNTVTFTGSVNGGVFPTLRNQNDSASWWSEGTTWYPFA